MTEPSHAKKCSLDIATFDGEHENRATIPGYSVAGGLAVHRTWSAKRLEKTWDVTHARTGLRIGAYFTTRAKARPRTGR